MVMVMVMDGKRRVMVIKYFVHSGAMLVFMEAYYLFMFCVAKTRGYLVVEK